MFLLLSGLHDHLENCTRGTSRPLHQGSAMHVLARIESVNMYWYVLVCIVACILVRIGMFEPDTY